MDAKMRYQRIGGLDGFLRAVVSGMLGSFFLVALPFWLVSARRQATAA